MPVVEIADAVRVRVPAKVNLHLSVGSARPDGFHDLTTVFQAVTMFDDVVARTADGLHVKASGTFSGGVPVDHTNLAYAAAELLAGHAAIDAGALLELHKAIPVGGGMAGGSADAAGALVACAALWRTGTPRLELHELAAMLGSDVPFALSGGTALGVGRGERLTPVLATGEYHWVFAMSDRGLSTPQVYRTLDELRADGSAPEPIGSPDELLDALRSGDCGRVADCLGNDLQPAALALRPELADVLAAGADLGALGGVISGSGPTCAFLCAHADAAQDLADELDRADVCSTTRVATAPAPGARVTG
jgi:4-diphosphocytidyl-2-C-methyl-D-erythritol kinase